MHSEPDPLPQGDSPIPLLDFDRSYVAKADSWSTSAPGTAFSYSNTGASITGLLVETISGMNLQVFAKAHVFDPLGMKEASFSSAISTSRTSPCRTTAPRPPRRATTATPTIPTAR